MVECLKKFLKRERKYTVKLGQETTRVSRS